MTERNFTDDDVIKALRELQEMSEFTPPICHYEKDITEPPFCKPFDQFQNDVTVALALISRQKAEIERLQAVHADMTESLRLASEANKDMQAEIEKLGRDRYQVLPDGRLELIPRTDINAIKAEAIKEFAERLKGKAEFTTIAGYRDYCRLINALVKEMTEADDESQNT